MPSDQNFKHIANGLNLVPNSSTKVLVPGDIDYSSDTGSFNLFDSSGATTISTANGVQTLTNKTISASSNTITGLTNTNLNGSAAITNGNLATMPTLTIKGNVTGGSAIPTDLTGTQVNTILPVFTTSLNGLVPASGGGTTNFLRADGTFAAPSAGSGVTSIGTINSQTKAANGAVITGTSLVMQEADATHNGLISTGAQSFGGTKTFSGISTNTITDNGASLNINGGGFNDMNITPGTGALLYLKGPIGTALKQISTPGIFPASGFDSLYFKSDDNLYRLTSAGVETQIGGSTSTVQIAYISDQKSSGTNGGTFTSGAWQVRDLNTLSTVNSPSWITANGTNNFTLATGVYDIEASAPAYQVNNHKIKLINTTDVVDVLFGTTEESVPTGNVQTRTFLQGAFVVSGSKSFQIQHQCLTTASGSGFGDAASFSGIVEIYTQVKITKIG